jgi:hypothetical protein
MVSGLFEKKRDAIPPHPTTPQAQFVTTLLSLKHFKQRFNCVLKARLVQHSATGLRQEVITSNHSVKEYM